MKNSIITFLICASASLSFAQKADKRLVKELERIYKDDQQYRRAAIEAAKKHGSGSAQDHELMNKQLVADLQNLDKIEKIIATYGYPGKSLVGERLSKVAFLVVQHNELPAQEKYLPFFETAVKQNELDRSLLPLMIDRIRTSKGELQLYGTQLREHGANKVQLYPIFDEPNVNNRRKEMGLPTLETYLLNWKLKYVVPTANENKNDPDLYVSMENPINSSEEIDNEDLVIFRSLKYPARAKTANVTGEVVVQFEIDTKGNTTDVSVVKSLGFGCDEEALRVIKAAKFTNNTGESILRRMRLPFPYN